MTGQRVSKVISRRSVLAGLGAGGLAFALAPVAGRAGAQEAGTAEITAEMGVLYWESGGTQLLLDIYRPPTRDSPRPAVLLLHGGGLGAGDRSWMTEGAQYLAAAGYVAISAGYRLFDGGETNPWPAQLDDTQRALRWVRKEAPKYGIDPERIGAFGHSSGGQLAAFLGTRDARDEGDEGDSALAGVSSRATCVVDVAGPMDLTIPFPDDGFNTFYAALLGGTADAPPGDAAYRDFSPIAFVDEQSAPFLILQGGADDVVPIEHSRRMAEALRDAGIEVIEGEFPGRDHFSIYDWPLVGPETLAFLGRHLRPEE